MENLRNKDSSLQGLEWPISFFLKKWGKGLACRPGIRLDCLPEPFFKEGRETTPKDWA